MELSAAGTTSGSSCGWGSSAGGSGGSGSGGAAARRLLADAERLAQLAQAPLLVVVEAAGSLSSASSSDVRRSRRIWLMTTSSASSSRQRRRQRLDRLVGQRDVLQHRLAQLALGAVADGPGRTGGRRLAVLEDRQQLVGRERRQRLVGRGARSASSSSATSRCSSSRRSSGLRGSAPCAAISRRSRGDPALPELVDERVGGAGLRHSALAAAAVGRRPRRPADERGQALPGDHDVACGPRPRGRAARRAGR